MTKNRLFKTLIILAVSSIVVLLLLYSIGLFKWAFVTTGYDSFGNIESNIYTDKNSYNIGDSIELQLELESGAPRDIRLFEKKWKSIFLSISPKEFRWHGGFDKIVKYQGSAFAWRVEDDKTISDDDRIEKIRIDKTKSYKLVIRGKIAKDTQAGHIIFDFYDFGSFEMLRQSSGYNIILGKTWTTF